MRHEHYEEDELYVSAHRKVVSAENCREISDSESLIKLCILQLINTIKRIPQCTGDEGYENWRKRDVASGRDVASESASHSESESEIQLSQSSILPELIVGYPAEETDSKRNKTERSASKGEIDEDQRASGVESDCSISNFSNRCETERKYG